MIVLARRVLQEPMPIVPVAFQERTCMIPNANPLVQPQDTMLIIVLIDVQVCVNYQLNRF